MKGDNSVGLLVLACVVILAAVCILLLTLDRCVIDPIYEFDEIPDLGIQTIQDAMTWVACNIDWVDDAIHYPADEYWQSPAQTYVWRSGDCEDYCILAMYLVYRDVGIKGRLCMGYAWGGGHAWVYVDGHYWEPQTAWIIDDNPNYSFSYSINYDEVIKRSTTTHKAVEMEQG